MSFGLVDDLFQQSKNIVAEGVVVLGMLRAVGIYNHVVIETCAQLEPLLVVGIG